MTNTDALTHFLFWLVLILGHFMVIFEWHKRTCVLPESPLLSYWSQWVALSNSFALPLGDLFQPPSSTDPSCNSAHSAP